MKLPNFPLLSQRESINNNTFCDHKSLKDCNVTFCECTNVVHIPLGDVVEIILVDKGNYISVLLTKVNYKKISYIFSLFDSCTNGDSRKLTVIITLCIALMYRQVYIM